MKTLSQIKLLKTPWIVFSLPLAAFGMGGSHSPSDGPKMPTPPASEFG